MQTQPKWRNMKKLLTSFAALILKVFLAPIPFVVSAHPNARKGGERSLCLLFEAFSGEAFGRDFLFCFETDLLFFPDDFLPVVKKWEKNINHTLQVTFSICSLLIKYLCSICLRYEASCFRLDKGGNSFLNENSTDIQHCSYKLSQSNAMVNHNSTLMNFQAMYSQEYLCYHGINNTFSMNAQYFVPHKL